MTEQKDDPVERRLAGWIGANVGCTVVSMERQQRWRPCWYVDVRMADGTARSLYVRGERSIYVPENRVESGITAFESEYRIMQVLEAEGIAVPHVHGMCPDPMAIVTDRAAGRHDLATAVSDAERAAVMDQYLEQLARIHAIDPAKFDGITLPRPQSPDQIALAQYANFEAIYRDTKRRPEPVLEFLLQWIKRNAPRDRTRLSFLVCDVAQFMFEDSRLTAMLDLEMAYLGDAVQDLAALQHRATSEPLGDIARALRHYEKVTGRKIDPAAYDFHVIAFGLLTPLGMTDSVTRPLPTNSVLQYLEWWVNFCRVPLELIAAVTGRALPEAEPLIVEPLPFGPMAESLPGAIEAIPVEEGFATFERGTTAKLARFVARMAECGPAMMRQDKAETEQLLGTRFADAQAADAALEAYVLAAGPEQDDRLIPLLYRRVQRQWQLVGPFKSTPTAGARLKTFAQLMET